MKLHSLKLPKKSKKELAKEMAPTVVGEQDSYPWGTRVRFDRETFDLVPGLEALEVGDEVTVQARAKVIEKRAEERQGGKASRSIELQLTKIAVQSQESFDAGFDDESEEES